MAQYPAQQRPPLQTGISKNVYSPLDPRNYADEDPLDVKPIALNAYYQRDGSLQCIPPVATWRLLERYANRCLYAVPLIPAERCQEKAGAGGTGRTSGHGRLRGWGRGLDAFPV